MVGRGFFDFSSTRPHCFHKETVNLEKLTTNLRVKNGKKNVA